MGHVSGQGAKQRALNLARKLSRETVNDYVVLDDGSESFTILTAKDAQSLNLGSQYKVLETTTVTENDDGTCSSSIAAGPAQNLLAPIPKKKKKQSKIGEACSSVNEKHQDQPDDEYHELGGKKKKKKIAEEFNPQDIIKMDVPLFIRMLEYAKEDAKTDMDLHNVTEKLIQMSANSEAVSMDQYDAIVGSEQVTEAPMQLHRVVSPPGMPERDKAHYRQAYGNKFHDTDAVNAANSEKERARYAKSKEGKMEELRMTKIPRLDWQQIEQLAKKSIMGLGGEIADVIGRKNTTYEVKGVEVAARTYALYIAYNMDDFGYDQETIDRLSGGSGEGLSDLINVIVYRDPQNPRKLCLTYNNDQSLTTGGREDFDDDN